MNQNEITKRVKKNWEWVQAAFSGLDMSETMEMVNYIWPYAQPGANEELAAAIYEELSK